MAFENNVQATLHANVAIGATTVDVVKAVAPNKDVPVSGRLTLSATDKTEIISYTGRTNPVDSQTFAVTAVGGNYIISSVANKALTLKAGSTYIFTYPSGHPFRFSTTSDGTHGSGSEYTTGVTHNSSTQTTIIVSDSTPTTLYYYCSYHSNMGGDISVISYWTLTGVTKNAESSFGDQAWSAGDACFQALTAADVASLSTINSSTAPTNPRVGDRWFNTTNGVLVQYFSDGTDSAWLDIAKVSGSSGAVGAATGGVTAYANLAAFPATHTAASMGYATDTNAAYMSDGTSWQRMSIGSQVGPQYSTPPPAAHTLDPTGGATSISAVAVDESGFPVTYDWDALVGNTVYSASSLPPQLTAVSESSGTFTLTASTNESHKGTIAFRIKASDGVLSTPFNCAVTLSFKEFYGLAFFANTAGMFLLNGDGVTSTFSSMSQLTTASTVGRSGFAHRDANRDVFFYRYYSGTMYKHDVSGTLLSNFSFASNRNQCCTDGTYMYATDGGTIFRKHITTLVDTNITGISMNAPAANQGAWVVYHDGHLYSKYNANATNITQYSFSTNTVTTFTDNLFSSGSYCDGGCVVTNTAGVSFIVEAGTTYTWVLNLNTLSSNTIPIRLNTGTGSSTEYGNGAAEISAGVALIYGENSDRTTLVDTNTNPPTVTSTLGTASTHKPVHANGHFGNSFGFAGGIV